MSEQAEAQAPEQAVDVEGESARPATEEQSARREAALAEVRTFGDPVLRSRASDLTDFGPETELEAERMAWIMRDAMGVGLAAAILIDATLVRAVLLPATMKLLGKRNWYLPRGLRWLPKFEHEPQVAPAAA